MSEKPTIARNPNKARSIRSTKRLTAAVAGLTMSAVAILAPSAAAANLSTQSRLSVPEVFTVRNGSAETMKEVSRIRREDEEQNVSTAFVVDSRAATFSPRTYQGQIRRLAHALDVVTEPAQVLVDIVPTKTHTYPIKQRENRLVDTAYSLSILSKGVLTSSGSDSHPENQLSLVIGRPYAETPEKTAEELRAAGFRSTDPNTGLTEVTIPPEQALAAEDYITATEKAFKNLPPIGHN